MSRFSRRTLLRNAIIASAAAQSGFAGAESLLSAIGIDTSPDVGGNQYRERLLLDFGWKFRFGHASDPAQDLGFGSDQGAFSKSGDFSFAKPTFDDSNWRSLNLPHDWAVELPFVHDDSLKSHGYKPLGRAYPATSVGWYRRSLAISKDDFGKRITIQFDGAFRSALIFVNGFFIGRNDNGYCPFEFDVTDLLNYGGGNSLVVRMDASFGDGWFYEGAGLYRHVWLGKTNAVHLGTWESYVRSDVAGDVSTLHLGTVVKNESTKPAGIRVRWTILDSERKTVASLNSLSQTVAADSAADFTASTKMAHPKLWSPDSPNLYSSVLTVEVDGRAVDSEEHTFGVRTTKFDANKGFFLNGKSVKIKGTCNHQDHAGVGAALPDRLQYFRLAVLKEMGSNAVRTSHNMPTPEWVEACDRMGMMMMCETRQMNSSAEALAQLETMIKRFRNSPSIILWSMGNEEWPLQSQPAGERVVAKMVERSHELDPSRLCSAATTSPFDNSVAKALDVEGFNYSLSHIDEYHKSHPLQPSVGSETSSAINTRGVYTTDKLRNWMSAYDVNHTEWSELAEEWWKFYANRDFLPGGFAWTGFDYRGEPTPYGWPSVSSQFGIVDTCGFPKDSYWYYKSWWSDKPVLHLFPHWNWDQRFGEPIQVWVHSNAEEVELFLNGKSQGKKQVTPLTHLEWSVKYEPGVLEARASKGGRVTLVEKRETTGVGETIRLTSDRTEVDANGEDVAFIRVEVLDAKGRAVPTADNLILFKISGAGTLIGVGNGDPNCQESDKEPKRSLFNGLAQLIVQSTKTPGDIVIEAHSEDWPGKLPSVAGTVDCAIH